MKPGRIVALVAILALAGFLLWSSLGARRATCRVCAEYQGQRNCATASAATEKEAQRSAQSTACGTIARGMAESIMCSNAPPVSVECHRR
ncbi:MAG TPA: hypothetical protein VFS44_03480 [Gemmatimonadaceae bacterium]|nr:hypothetical protein [Gemmatimonadaceae bacterium]